MSGFLDKKGLITPKITTDEIVLKGKPISDALAGATEIKVTSSHSLGDFYFSLASYMPEGVVPLNGSEISRVVYSDLYDYVQNIHNELATQNKKFLISEEEWQNISIENNGYVPYYSYGSSDGMFRVPRMSGYIKATGEVNEAGEYIAEGLPNPQLEFLYRQDGVSSGVYTDIYKNDGITVGISDTNSADEYMQTHKALADTRKVFDVRINEQIYGNSEHVTPETNTLFVGIWALNAFTQVGTANLAEIKEIINQSISLLGDSLPLLSSRYDNKGLETSAWKLSKGQWLDGRIYSQAFDKLAEKLENGDSTVLEMKESELISTSDFPENFLLDKDNKKFRLPLFVVNERTIIKEWKDGTEWYRIWSDGYLEQGGHRNQISTDSYLTISFFVPFKDTNYTFVDTAKMTSASSVVTSSASISLMSESTIKLVQDTNVDSGGIWIASGYINPNYIPPREEWEIDFNYYFKVSHGVDEGRINIEEKLTEFEETAYNRLDEVVEEVSKDYVVHVDKTVGELYFSFNDYFPDGVIPLDGRLVSRATYADLWEFVQSKGLVKNDSLITTNDENTVSIFNEDGSISYCPWYGTGDGSLTFRMPKINGYARMTGDNTLAGEYIEEGLPNITGRSGAYENLGGYYLTSSGALKTIHAGNTSIGGGGTGAYYYSDLDASRSNSIYGNSEHVTPETNTLFVGVWAITAAKAAVFDMRDIEEILKSSESYLMNNVPLMSSRWDRDGLGNLGWVKADGSWVDGRTYTGAYNYCVEKLIAGDGDFVDGQVAAITTDNCSKFIVDRINKRFRLPVTNGSRALVASYKEGTQWYNMYSDGWIEQGGEYYNNADTLVTIDLLIPFKDTNYTADKILGIDGRYTNSFSPDYTATWNYTTSSFTTRTYGSAGLNRFRWFAAGYGEVLSVSSPERTSHLYFKLAHEFYAPAEASIQEKLDLIDNLAGKVDINLPTLSSRWDSNFAENLGWVKSEGQWLNGNTYRDAYDMMVARIGVDSKFVAATEGTNLTKSNSSKFLIDTTAVKFRLPLTNGERVLVQKVDTSTSMCDIYSDGYCEQHGRLDITSTESTKSFIVPFNDAPYISFHRVTNRGATSSDRELYPRSLSATSFTYAMYTSDVTYARWSAIGHISGIPSVEDYNCGTYLYFKLGDAVPSTVVDTQGVIDDLHQKCNDYQDTMDAILALGSDYICGCMIPDYTTGIELTSNVETVMPYHAWIMARCQNDNSNGWAQTILQVNGTTVGVANVTSNCQDTCSCFVKKGDRVIAKTSGENGTRTYVTRCFRLSGASAE